MSNVTKVRASSWGELFDCGARWEAKHLMGMRMPSGAAALLGTAIHAGTAQFDTARMLGTPMSPDDAAGVIIETLRHPEFDVDWNTEERLTPRKAEGIALALHTLYCLEWSPRFEFLAVEMPTDPYQIDCGGGVIIEITGTMDRSRLVKHHIGGGGVGISDLKSGAAAVEKGVAKTKGHKAQLGCYELLHERTLQIPITEDAEIIGLKTSGAPEIATGMVSGAKNMMIGTETSPGMIDYAAEMFRTGRFLPNPSSMLCSPKFCPRWSSCTFHS